MTGHELDDVAGRLYTLPPEEFTAARDAAAGRAGDKPTRDAVKTLRRPGVGAWLVNRLASDQPDLLEQVLTLGPALAEAQRPDRHRRRTVRAGRHRPGAHRGGADPGGRTGRGGG